MAICCVIRPPHRLGGVAKSRSLVVATPPLILRELPQRRDFAKLNLHLALFEQPGKEDFFSRVLDLKERSVYGRGKILKEFGHPKYFMLTTER